MKLGGRKEGSWLLITRPPEASVKVSENDNKNCKGLTGPPDTIYIPFDGRDNLAGRIRDRYVVAVAVVVSKPNSWSSRELTVCLTSI